MAKKKSFRVGRVTAYLRGHVWYLRYHENGRRRQVRGWPDKTAVRQLAAQVNAQLETGAPAVTSFEAVSIGALRDRWLDYHEHVLRSSVATINRYRTATAHLMNFIQSVGAVQHVSHFRPSHAELFVRYLRELKVAPNGHANARKRTLRGKGIKYILEVYRTLFNFAIKRRHLPPYTDNPFTAIEIDRIPVEDVQPFVDLNVEQERAFLESCDAWQFPFFLTLLLTGLRPGELTHLLLPDDLDLEEGLLHVRNKPDLGWQVKTRNERTIPLVPELCDVLRVVVGERIHGSVFMRYRFCRGVDEPALLVSREQLHIQLQERIKTHQSKLGRPLSRQETHRLAQTLWRDAGAIKPDRIRIQFMQLTKSIGLPGLTAPKTLRHMFATMLQDTNVDPLIRNQLMGHAPARGTSSTSGLGMTGVYTHTRSKTLRSQLENACRQRPALDMARRWLINRVHSPSVSQACTPVSVIA